MNSLYAQVRAMVVEDRVIDAIKHYRSCTNCSLKDSKHYVDRVIAEVRGGEVAAPLSPYSVQDDGETLTIERRTETVVASLRIPKSALWEMLSAQFKE